MPSPGRGLPGGAHTGVRDRADGGGHGDGYGPPPAPEQGYGQPQYPGQGYGAPPAAPPAQPYGTPPPPPAPGYGAPDPELPPSGPENR